MSNSYPKIFEFCRQGVSIELEAPEEDPGLDFYVAGVPYDDPPSGIRGAIELVILERTAGKLPGTYPGKVTLKVGYYKPYEENYSVHLYGDDNFYHGSYSMGKDNFQVGAGPFFNGYGGYFQIEFDNNFPDPRIGIG